jgi:hypothetical protein
MTKITLYFGNPAYLKTKDEQLVFVIPRNEGSAKSMVQMLHILFKCRKPYNKL